MSLIDGQRFIKEKKFNKALDIFVNLEKNNHPDYRIFFYLGLVCFELNYFNRSIAYYKKFLLQNPNAPNALLNLAIVKQTIGDTDYAKRIYLKLIDQNHLNIRAYYGLYLLDTKYFIQQNFEILLKIQKNNKLNLYDTAIVNFLLSKYEKSQKKLK